MVAVAGVGGDAVAEEEEIISSVGHSIRLCIYFELNSYLAVLQNYPRLWQYFNCLSFIVLFDNDGS